MKEQEVRTSRLTSKYQATIPASVRERLELGKGDMVAFHIEGQEVVLRKASPLDLEYLRSLEDTLGEWNSEADDEAYGKL